MSFAAYKMMHWPTGIENCASGFISDSRVDFVPRMHPIQTDDMESDWPPTRREIGPIPDLVVTAGNVLMHGNVVTMAVLSGGGGDGSRRRDSIVLAFEDAKISVLEFDDSIHGLRGFYTSTDGMQSYQLTCTGSHLNSEVKRVLGESSIRMGDLLGSPWLHPPQPTIPSGKRLRRRRRLLEVGCVI